MKLILYLIKSMCKRKINKSDVCLHVIDAIIGEEVSINKKSYPNKLQNSKNVEFCLKSLVLFKLTIKVLFS